MQLPSKVGEHEATDLSGHSGIQCYGALGADVLCETQTLFDFSDGRLEIGCDDKPEGVSFELTFTNEGCPVAWLDLVSQDYQPFLLSTGTRFSYLRCKTPIWFAPKKSGERDYIWELGAFETVSRAHFSRDVSDTSPTKPRFLHDRKVSDLCSRKGVQGILGWEFLDGRTVYLDRIKGEITISRTKGKGVPARG